MLNINVFGFWLIGTIGAVIDSFFIFSPYHVKHKIEYFKTVITFSVMTILACFILPAHLGKTLTIVTLICLPFFFDYNIRRTIKNIFYFLVPILLIAVIESLLTFIMPINILFYLICNGIKITIIFLFYEDKNYIINFNFLNISLKISFLIMVLLFACIIKYYSGW